jgi:mRNA interferase RelE/StbE
VESFTVRLSSRAGRQLEGLDKKTRAAISEELLEMEFDPYGGDHQKLKGAQNYHRRRVGKYRILYDIDTGFKLVNVYQIVHRKDAYR